jgi:hypothetical protein
MLVGVWLAAVGLLFAIAPDGTSRLADRFRVGSDPQPPTPAQNRYARAAGVALVCAGVLVMVVFR